MNTFKKFLVGALVTLPILYAGLQYVKGQGSFEGKIISEDEIWISSGSHPAYLDAQFGGYFVVSERYLDGRLQRDTTIIPALGKEYYIDKVPGYSYKTADDWYTAVNNFKKEQKRMINSLTPGRRVRLSVGDINTTYHSITPDDITIL